MGLSSSKVRENVNIKENTVLGDKEEHFVGKGTDLSALASHIEEYLKTNGYTVQTSPRRARRATSSKRTREGSGEPPWRPTAR